MKASAADPLLSLGSNRQLLTEEFVAAPTELFLANGDLQHAVLALVAGRLNQTDSLSMVSMVMDEAVLDTAITQLIHARQKMFTLRNAAATGWPGGCSAC